MHYQLLMSLLLTYHSATELLLQVEPKLPSEKGKVRLSSSISEKVWNHIYNCIVVVALTEMALALICLFLRLFWLYYLQFHSQVYPHALEPIAVSINYSNLIVEHPVAFGYCLQTSRSF